MIGECYDLLIVNVLFLGFVYCKSGFIGDDNTGYTDIWKLYTNVCGTNICIGDTYAHTSNEKISI